MMSAFALAVTTAPAGATVAASISKAVAPDAAGGVQVGGCVCMCVCVCVSVCVCVCLCVCVCV